VPFEIKGLDEFNAKLKKMKEDYPDYLDEAMDDTADTISLVAQINVPVDTGRLRSSINVERAYLRKSIGTNIAYALFVELGNPIGTGPNGGPRPYLRPAFIRHSPRVEEFLKKIIAAGK